MPEFTCCEPLSGVVACASYVSAYRIMRRPRLWKSYRGLRVVKELLVLVVGDGLALDANIHQRAAHNADAHAFSDFDFKFVVINNLLNLADNAAAGHDGIAATNPVSIS